MIEHIVPHNPYCTANIYFMNIKTSRPCPPSVFKVFSTIQNQQIASRILSPRI